MNVNNNLAAVNSYRNLSANQTSVANGLERLSSGYRINSAADDAAGLAISEGMRSLTGGLERASQNAQNGVSLIQTAEGGLSGTQDALTRMRELAVQASNGTMSDTDRAMLNREFGELRESISGIAESTNYNGINLLDGTQSDGLTLQIGAQGGADQRMQVAIGDMGADALGLSDLDISTAAGANAALEAIDAASEIVSSTRGDLGATQNRLESTISNLEAARFNTTASEATIRDLDMAREAMNQSTRHILSESSNAVQAQSMNLMRQNAMALLVR
ncbi:MAG: flagellin [Oscillospiraceae bacterium]|nr:flagellin [Oscillospiraceae bacterium]